MDQQFYVVFENFKNFRNLAKSIVTLKKVWVLYILMDMPEIINNVNLIIMENEYWDLSHKKCIDVLCNRYSA